MTIGKAIKTVRESKGIAQSEVERKTGLKKEYLSRIENGHLTNQTYDTLLKIAKVLDIKLSELIAMTEGATNDL